LVISIQIDQTSRGFNVGTFVDRYGSTCSVQDSSLASEAAIWLGVDVPFEGCHDGSVRMHLTKPMVKDLLTYLNNFVDQGTIVGQG
jgi:hypothetical protein